MSATTVMTHGRGGWNAGCRCETCTRKQRDYMAGWMAATRMRTDIPHGTLSGYHNWGCRCVACFPAGQMKNALDRARRKVREGRPLSQFEAQALAGAGGT